MVFKCGKKVCAVSHPAKYSTAYVETRKNENSDKAVNYNIYIDTETKGREL